MTGSLISDDMPRIRLASNDPLSQRRLSGHEPLLLLSTKQQHPSHKNPLTSTIGMPKEAKKTESDSLDDYYPVMLCVIATLLCIIIILICFGICYCVLQKRKKNRSRHQRHPRSSNESPPMYTPRNDHTQNGVEECIHCSRRYNNSVYQTGSMAPQQWSHCYTPSGNRFHQFPGGNSMTTETEPRDLVTLSQFPHQTFPPNRECPVINPVFDELSDDESISVFNNVEGPLKDLYKVSERSSTKTVGNKLVVSVCHSVDQSGDVLYLDNMGISLQVPSGAVKRGQRRLISLVLNWDLSDNPAMEKSQSLVSPVVYVGPHGLKLEQPCTLSFRHCSFDPRQIQVMRSETDLNDAKSWRKMEETEEGQGEETEDKISLNADECQLQISSFTLYTCIQSPAGDQGGKKWLQIAAFACPLRRHIIHHQIRVYFLNKTPCALQWAIQNEAKFGGKMVCPEKVFLFDGNEKDMFAVTKHISNDWELVDDENKENVSFLTIWHGHCPHMTICYRRPQYQNSVQQHPNQEDIAYQAKSVSLEINLRLFMFQDQKEKEGEKLVIQISEDNISPMKETEIRCTRHHLDIIEIDIPRSPIVRGRTSQERKARTVPPTDLSVRHKFSSNDACCARGSKDSSSKLKVIVNTPDAPQCELEEDLGEIARSLKHELPYKLRNQLKLLLDPLNAFGNDWRELAEKLDLDNCINFLLSKESPTSCLLDHVENRNISLSKLRQIFKAMGRKDCVSVIDKHLEAERQKSPVENACP